MDMYEPMHSHKKELMKNNHEYIESMLDFAIEQLVEIARDNDIWLMDNGHVCESYDDIFCCLKHWSEKRRG